MQKVIVVVVALLRATIGIGGGSGGAMGFDFASVFRPPANPFASAGGKGTMPTARDEESRLLRTIADTGNGKDADLETQARVLSIVRRLETGAVPSPTLLSNIQEAKSLLDGDWFLRYTAPSEIIDDDDVGAGGDGIGDDDGWVAIEASEGESKINTRRFGDAGRVSGGGIPVDASNAVAVQSFDVEKSRVTNVITTGIGLVTVGGTYRRSDSVPLRAIVAFDTATIALNVKPFVLDLSFLFDVRAAIKGTREAGWLETTYVSDNVRIGRGNKGSLFILTRDRDDAVIKA
ncbi:hypothetical protein ACHAW5_007709 [Stephanodiscus triporus]|uniref:Plastid lipid-associated protein/fibrillin conserved domain-containing protein n=1 Tax=Stephanodiscus triporus TaxID=2934178 RepID=A0ABD3MI86_9STRA